MFLLSIVKLLSIFIFVYFLFSLFRIIFKVIGSLKKNAKEVRDTQSPKTGDKGSIIELKKDQYKVE
jgi:hypothetical protein